MRDNTVSIDTSQSPTVLTYADSFNVSVPFIDRHLDEGRADKVVIRMTTGEEVTYGQLAQNVNRTGNALKDLGLSKGDRVLMMVMDCPEFYYIFWGAIKAGFIPVPLNTLLVTKDYKFMIEDSGCEAVLYSKVFAEQVEPALKEANRSPKAAFCVDGGETPFQTKIAEGGATLEPAPAKATDDCFWLYSSGTTGTPKGTVHSHRDMVVTSQHYGIDTLGVKEDDVCFSAAKLFFAYGLGNAMTFPLWAGATAVLFPARPMPDNTLEIIAKHKPTLYFGVPTLYAGQLQYMASNSFDMSSVRYCISAGEALPADIFKRWKEKTGTTILDGIGSTEALHIFISNTADDSKAGTSGRIVPGYEAKIIDERDQPVPDGESGRLFIRGHSTAKYYWNNPEKTASTMVDGWLSTGDTYVRDEEGYFVYCGRDDDMLKVGGIWCSPFEIEAKLIEHPKVLEAAIVGRADDKDLIKPEAWIVLADGIEKTDELQQDLIAHCKSGLAKYKFPRWFNFVEELPKTATGKIQRFKLRH